jgi:formylglycine-generating enzyme required for sulfatase activity
MRGALHTGNSKCNTYFLTGPKWYYLAREKLNPEKDYGIEHERPATWVTLTQPFWLGTTEVTQEQYERMMGTNPSAFIGPNLPVAGLIQAMAQDRPR